MARSFDPFCEQRVPPELWATGLVEVNTEGRVFCWEGGSAGATAWRLTFEQLGKELIATGGINPEELAAVIRLLDDPSVTFLSQATVTAWGQRPAA